MNPKVRPVIVTNWIPSIYCKWDFSANSEAHRRDLGYSTTPASSYPEEFHLDAHEDTRAETEGLDGELLEDSIEINLKK